VHSLIPTGALDAFDPKTIVTLGLAFEMAWQSLLASASPLAVPAQADQSREALALRIIEAAKTGERDVKRLTDDAIAYVLENS
jgi:hypothetical protein